MKVEGKLIPPKQGKKTWGVEIDSLGIFTQGKSRKNALEMAAEAIELLAEDAGLPFKSELSISKNNVFSVGSSDILHFLPFVLKRMRETRKLTTMEVAERLKSRSPNAYAAYEQGNRVPSVEKLETVLKAIDPSARLVLKSA